ncbi:MAG: Tol-Pal system beta propeller repeat protein TolB [Maricaulaceae bacterium]
MLNRILSRFIAAIAGLGLIAGSAVAQLEIDVTQGHLDPLKVAVPTFLGATEQERILGEQIAQVVTNNLQRSGLFAPINPAAFIETQSNIDITPRFQDWRIINTQALLSGRVRIGEAGALEASFRLWDVVAESQLRGQRIESTPENWRRIAHKISDAVYERLTGEPGYFDTRVVFIAESGPKTARVKRLAIMDQDGANPSFLTNGSYTVLTPRFSPTLQEITYLSYLGDRPNVFIFNIETGRQESLGDFPGMTFAPRFSPDGSSVIMSLERDGDSDIYVMDLRTRTTTQLTDSPAIDTSPSFAPDGERVTFTSDRGGSPQIYVMNADGSEVQRISFGQGSYSTPVWSPRGDLIAFTKQHQGQFHIGVMRPDGSAERLLTESFLDEGPTWSPNGRVLLFTREQRGLDAQSEIWSVDLTGRNLAPAPTPGPASDPAWSPLIQ